MIVRRGILIISLGAILFGIAVPYAASDGGFFWPDEFEVYQNAERVVFTVNGDGTITIVLGISYEGDAEEFSWVFPVPSVPELAVAETASLEILETATALQLEEPPHPCRYLRGGKGGAGGGGPDVVMAGDVGPYDYVVLGDDGDPGALITWLREHNYQVSAEIEPVITAYVEEGMFFLAMRLRRDASIQDIQPLVITYEAYRVVFPIRLTAAAAVEDMPIKIWIFADQQYVPQNYAHEVPDFSRFRAASQVANTGYTMPYNENGATSYGFTEELARFQEQHDGHVFLTRYAGPSALLLSDGRYYRGNLTEYWGHQTDKMVREDAFLMDLIMRFPYLTYLWTRMSPDQMTVDPRFVSDAQAEDVSSVIDLSRFVNPIDYWGCSSAHALSDAQWASLPEERTYFADLRLDVAHPADWVLSTLEIDRETEVLPAYVYAPEAVDRSTIEAFFAGEPTPPMFVFVEGRYHYYFQQEYNTAWWARQDEFRWLFDLPRPEDIFAPEEGQLPVYFRYDPPESGTNSISWFGGNDAPIVFLSMLASEEDWATDGPMYEAMLAYARAYQFYTTPDLRHTLFLDGYALKHYTASNIQIPYPSGWEVSYFKQHPNDIMLKPRRVSGETYIPYVRLISLRQVVAPAVFDEDGDILGAALDWIWQAYRLPEDDREEEWRHALRCEGQTLPFSLGRDEVRSGWVKLTGLYVIEYSTTPEYLEEYEDVLQLMAESTPAGISCE